MTVWGWVGECGGSKPPFWKKIAYGEGAKKSKKKTNNSAFSATPTYIKLTLVNFFLLFFMHLPLMTSMNLVPRSWWVQDLQVPFDGNGIDYWDAICTCILQLLLVLVEVIFQCWIFWPLAFFYSDCIQGCHWYLTAPTKNATSKSLLQASMNRVGRKQLLQNL